MSTADGKKKSTAGATGKNNKNKKKGAAAYNPANEIKEMTDIHEVLEKAQQLRNYFQVERDKVSDMWDVSKKDLENTRFALENVASEIEEMEKAHQVEMKVYKQKVRHLLYDQKVAVKQLRDESDAALQSAEEQHQKRMAEIAAARAKKTTDIAAGHQTHESAITDLRDSHQYMINVTKKQNHEKEKARLLAAYETKLESLREDLELRRRAEVNETEELKNDHIAKLIEQHEAKFAEMKEYYNSITRNNLEIIQSLKDEIATMKRNDEHNENLMYDIERENHNLVGPLEQAEKDVAELQAQKKQFIQDKQSLGMVRGRLRNLRDAMKTLEKEHQALEDEYKRTYDEREELKAKFEVSLREAMDTMDERNAALQQRLLEANARVEERDAQFGAVLQAMNLEPAALSSLSVEIDRELAVKNQIIKDMHFEVRKLEQKTNAVVTEYERRCRQVGLPLLAAENFQQRV